LRISQHSTNIHSRLISKEKAFSLFSVAVEVSTSALLALRAKETEDAAAAEGEGKVEQRSRKSGWQ
jgi:hypothetical protein